MHFSIIIPVYNRPIEVQELLESLSQQDYINQFEIVIVEDGSTNDCKSVVNSFIQLLDISYFYKENSGPGASRNYGMQRAKGDYFIIFDSDCVIPKGYLADVAKNLGENYIDCFGGPDGAQKSFSNIQKAINFAMTSFLTTGGIRGGNEKITNFEPRSFNMGLSKKAFEISGGFGQIHPGEDPDLSIRLWKLGFKTALLSDAFVYHKRRINWRKFYAQVNKFGKARPILNAWHPKYAKLTYFFPTFFIITFTLSLFLFIASMPIYLYLFLAYYFSIFMQSSIVNKSIFVGFLSIIAVFIQFFGYGFGFLNSFIKIFIFKIKPENAFPELFFNKTS